MKKSRYVSPFYAARIYAALGHKEQVFRLLNKALAEHSRMLDVKNDPIFDPFSSDKEFSELIKRIEFAPPD
jgi:hypothetical protein